MQPWTSCSWRTSCRAAWAAEDTARRLAFALRVWGHRCPLLSGLGKACTSGRGSCIQNPSSHSWCLLPPRSRQVSLMCTKSHGQGAGVSRAVCTGTSTGSRIQAWRLPRRDGPRRLRLRPRGPTGWTRVSHRVGSLGAAWGGDPFHTRGHSEICRVCWVSLTPFVGAQAFSRPASTTIKKVRSGNPEPLGAVH